MSPSVTGSQVEELLLRGRALSLLAGLLAGNQAAADELPEALEWLAVRPLDVEAVRRSVPALRTGAVPPYETSYEAGRTAPGGMTFQMADTAGFYRAFGFEVAGERPDHVIPELEFVALLLVKEAYALLTGDGDGAQVCAEARKKFLAEHLGAWLPELAARAVEVEGGARLADLARVAHRLATP